MSLTDQLSQLFRRTLPHIVISERGNSTISHSIPEHRALLLEIRNRRNPNLEFYLGAFEIKIDNSELLSECRDFVSSLLAEHIHDNKIQLARFEIWGGPVSGFEIDDLIQKLLELAIVHEPDNAAQLFINATEDDQCEFKQYTLLGSISVETSMQVCDGVNLIALPGKREEMPTYLPHSLLDPQLEYQFIGGTLLSVDWTVKPRFMNPQLFVEGEEGPFDGDFPFVAEMRSSLSSVFNVHEFCNALSLVAKTAVFQSIAWKHLSEDEVVNCSGGRGGMWHSHELIPRSPTVITTDQLEEARNLYDALMHLNIDDRTKLAVPIDRLIASWGSKGHVDQIIDLAISLESLYLPDDFTELAHRLRIRGARHLELDFERRRQLANHLKGFYNVRSKAVHSGKVSDTHKVNGKRITTVELIETTQEICLRSILNMVSDGFPDWEKLELG